ncbi:hypothetical protein [Streptomyces sp. NRRL F-5123]|nr:hypothetical protein [Streptomyces sp. NRRL F-5123]
MEWIDPRYGDLMKRLEQARLERLRQGDDRPVRGFILTAPTSSR